MYRNWPSCYRFECNEFLSKGHERELKGMWRISSRSNLPLQSMSPNIPYRFGSTSLFFFRCCDTAKGIHGPGPKYDPKHDVVQPKFPSYSFGDTEKKKGKELTISTSSGEPQRFSHCLSRSDWLLMTAPPSSSIDLHSHRPRAQGVRKMYLDCIQAMRTAGSVQLGFPGNWRCFKSFAFFNRQAIRPLSLSLFSWCQTERI